MSNDKLEMILEWSFGFSLLIFYSVLAHAIAVRTVTEANSYGLPIILNSLTGLGGAWGVLIVARSKDRRANGQVLKFPEPHLPEPERKDEAA